MKEKSKEKIIFVLYIVSLITSVILALVLFCSVTNCHKLFIPTMKKKQKSVSETSIQSTTSTTTI